MFINSYSIDYSTPQTDRKTKARSSQNKCFYVADYLSSLVANGVP